MNKIKFLWIAIITSVVLLGCKSDEDKKQLSSPAVNLDTQSVNVEKSSEELSGSMNSPGDLNYDSETDKKWLDELPSQDGEVYTDEGNANVPESTWTTSIVQDMINGDRMLYQNVSLNMHDLDGRFTEMTMYVREKKGKSFEKVDYEIFFKVDSGKYFCLESSCFVNTRIGDYINKYAYTDSKSNTFDTIFITSRGHFMDMMLNANELVVEANFFKDGNRQFIFDISNFPGKIYLDPEKP